MEKRKIAMMVEEETNNVCKMAEKLEDTIKHELDKGIENVDAKEMGEVVDMLKDLYEAKEKIVKACYYTQIMEAMEEEGFDDEEDIMDYGRRNYDNYRYKSSGRFAPKGRGSYMPRRGYEGMMTPDMYHEHEYDPEWYRDMDREHGRMNYSSGRTSSNMGSSSSRNYDGNYGRQSESRSERARRNYTESKEMHKGNSVEDKQKKMKDLEEYMKELSSDITDMIADSSQEEKQLLKQKLSTLVQKVG